MVQLRLSGLFLLLTLCRTVSGQSIEPSIAEHVDSAYSLHAVTFLDPECPISQKYTNTLNRLAGQFTDKGVGFYAVISARGTTRTQVDTFLSDYQIRFKAMRDSQLVIAKSLGATVTPEVFLLDQNLKVIYSGAIDNWFYDLGKSRRKPTAFFLREAIESYLNDRPIKTKRTDPVGCTISYRSFTAEDK